LVEERLKEKKTMFLEEKLARVIALFPTRPLDIYVGKHECTIYATSKDRDVIVTGPTLEIALDKLLDGSMTEDRKLEIALSLLDNNSTRIVQEMEGWIFEWWRDVDVVYDENYFPDGVNGPIVELWKIDWQNCSQFCYRNKKGEVVLTNII
jgi:hypothetical protein